MVLDRKRTMDVLSSLVNTSSKLCPKCYSVMLFTVQSTLKPIGHLPPGSPEFDDPNFKELHWPNRNHWPHQSIRRTGNGFLVLL